jgi:hypothetical protein
MSGCRRKYLDKCLRGGARLNEFVWRFQRPRRARKNQVRTSVLSPRPRRRQAPNRAKVGSDQGLGLRNRQAINDAQSASRSGSSPRDHYARDAARRNGVRTGLSPQSTKQEAESSSQEERRPREGADDGADSVACGQPLADCGFNLAALHPAYPIKCRTSTQRTQAS